MKCILNFHFKLNTRLSINHFFLILNLAVGGHWTDGYVAPGFDQAIYEIDYVRIYQ